MTTTRVVTGYERKAASEAWVPARAVWPTRIGQRAPIPSSPTSLPVRLLPAPSCAVAHPGDDLRPKGHPPARLLTFASPGRRRPPRPAESYLAAVDRIGGVQPNG